MGKYYLYCRENCYYSNEAKILIQKLNKKSEISFIKNTYENKEKIKNELREIIGKHDTFPIIFYKKHNGQNIFIGGYNELLIYFNNKNYLKF